jgi:hypothetical protein
MTKRMKEKEEKGERKSKRERKKEGWIESKPEDIDEVKLRQT